MRPARDFAGALKADRLCLIAEVKKASPSAGIIKSRLQPVALARRYAAGGAAAVSVLTEPKYFRGSLGHLLSVSLAVPVPVLRKDFLFDSYQVYEARANGADALLLIVAVLDQAQLTDLLLLTRRLGMEALVEVHDEHEVERALDAGAKVIGINNRDLRTFTVDLKTTERLRRLIPTDRVVVAESGIKNARDIRRLRQWGADAVLIGETLVTAPSPEAKIRELFG